MRIIHYMIGDELFERVATGEEVEVVQSEAAKIAEGLSQRLTKIQQGRRAWLDQSLDPDGLILANSNAQSGLPKGLATLQWCKTLGITSSLRQGKLEAGVIDWDDSLTDFSMFPKPHTASELMIEGGVSLYEE
jgi:hypothetical protein